VVLTDQIVKYCLLKIKHLDLSDFLVTIITQQQQEQQQQQ